MISIRFEIYKIATTTFFLLFALSAHAIEFDTWRTGMSQAHIISVVSDNDIPISKSGVIHINKGYNPKLLTPDFYKANELWYKTQLLGKQTTVPLKLTPVEAKWLYET